MTIHPYILANNQKLYPNGGDTLPSERCLRKKSSSPQRHSTFSQMFHVSHHILIGLKHKKEDYLVTLLPSPRTVEGSVAEGATNEAGRLFSADLRKMTLLPATIAHNVFPMLARWGGRGLEKLFHQLFHHFSPLAFGSMFSLTISVIVKVFLVAFAFDGDERKRTPPIFWSWSKSYPSPLFSDLSPGFDHHRSPTCYGDPDQCTIQIFLAFFLPSHLGRAQKLFSCLNGGLPQMNFHIGII